MAAEGKQSAPEEVDVKVSSANDESNESNALLSSFKMLEWKGINVTIEKGKSCKNRNREEATSQQTN